MGGWVDMRRGIEGRVDSQTVSAGSGLMDNVPLEDKLHPPRHGWCSSGVHTSFSTREFTNITVTTLCGKKESHDLKETGLIVLFLPSIQN